MLNRAADDWFDAFVRSGMMTTPHSLFRHRERRESPLKVTQSHRLGPRSYRCRVEMYGDRGTGKGSTSYAAFVAAYRDLKTKRGY